MKKIQSFRQIGAAALMVFGITGRCAASDEYGVMVHLQSGVNINDVAQTYGATIVGSDPSKNLYCLHSATVSDATLMQQLAADTANIASTEEDNGVTSAEVTGDPFHFSFDINANPGTFTNGATYVQINLGQAQLQAQGFGVVVAVLDTGVTASHPVLQNNIMAGFNTLQPNAAPADIADGMTNADVGHGTMIAGLIAHLAPNAAILPVRVMNGDGKGSIFAAAQGIHYAIAQGAKIITMSFGTLQSSGVLKDALDDAELAGVILVAAAGNNGANEQQVPAVGRHAIAVASVEADNTKSPYSNYGSFVQVVAPGSDIRSAFWNNEYASWSGTSFAAPMVAAEAALMLSVNPSPDEVVSIINRTCHSVDKFNPSFKNMLGKGVIDIAAAVQAAGGHGTTSPNATVSGNIALEELAANAASQSVVLNFRPTNGGASFNRIAPIGTNTAFSFSDIPANNYTVHVYTGRYLAVNLAVNATISNVTGLNVTLPAGDANSDNVVDIADFGILINAYGGDANLPGSNYDIYADFNGDSIVDIADFGLLVNNYGVQGDL